MPASLPTMLATSGGYDQRHPSLLPMLNVQDVERSLRSFAVTRVNGGSVVNLLGVWRSHGLPKTLHRIWQGDVMLAGISARSACWLEGRDTDPFGPQLRAVIGRLGFLPAANGVHMDSEDRRRLLIRDLVAEGTTEAT